MLRTWDVPGAVCDRGHYYPQFRDGEMEAHPGSVCPSSIHSPAVVGLGRAGTGRLTPEHTLLATGLSCPPSYSPWVVVT